jgi:hypothetical protein
MSRSTLRLLIIIFGLVTQVMPAPVTSAYAQETTPTPAPILILSPINGQAVQGMVSVMGTTTVAGFKSAEISFVYADDQTHTWFLIVETTEIVSGGQIAVWDTTTITDGEYILRLIVYLDDGSQMIVKAKGVRVRNYTPIETDTPVPTATFAPGQMPVPTKTPTSTATKPPPTPTSLPPNPVIISTQDITQYLVRGAILAFGLFVLVGLYGLVRKRLRKE